MVPLPERSQPRRSPIKHSAQWALTLLSVVLIAAACSSNNNKTASTVRATSTTETTATTVAATSTTDAPTTSTTTLLPRIGDSESIVGPGAVRIDVTLVRFVNPAPPYDQYSPPRAGMHFAAAQFRIKNTFYGTYQDTPDLDVSFIDPLGESFTGTGDLTAAGPAFPAPVIVAQGDTALGYVTIQVPNTSPVARVRYTLDSEYAQWDVSH